MRHFAVIVKNEFCRYFLSPLAYVYLVGFLLLNGSFAFYFGHFFERGRADLLPMFDFQPWIYLLFIPGIAMRLWAEEFRTKTILQTATLPVSLTALVWGKFAASWLFCALALGLTFPFWVLVNYLGTPDNAVILAGYLGSLLLAGSMLAISQTMSALTKNQVIALVLAVIVNLFFFLSGLEFVLELFRSFASPAAVDLLASFSFLFHFSTLSRGLLELRDVVFFGSLILLFNFATVLIISLRTFGSFGRTGISGRGEYSLFLAFLICAFCGLNLLANTYLRSFQIDFTTEQMYTLTPATKQVIANIKSPITARLYYSPLLGQRNSEVRQMFDNLRLVLQQYAALSEGKISLHLYNPEPFSNAEDRAISSGLQPLPIVDSNINAYFGLTLSDEQNRQRAIPFFTLERQNFLEPDLTEAIYLLGHAKPKLGIITSLPMFGNSAENVIAPKWEIINILEQYYDISTPTEDSDFAKLDVLLMAHPKNLSPALQNKIRDYSFGGGKILAFFDVAPEALALAGPVTETLSASDYGTLPEQWGFRFLDKAVVADFGNSTLIDAAPNHQTTPDFTQDLIQFYLRGQSFAPTPITARLRQIMLTSASVFSPLPGANITFEPLLSAGTDSQLLSVRAVYDHISPTEILRVFKPDNRPKTIAAHISGAPDNQPFELIVVGDSDLLYDNFWAEHQMVLDNAYTIPVLDNANFVLNALDSLRGETALLGLRGKNYISRPFAKVEALRLQAAKDFKLQEQEIFANLNRAKAGMQEILGKRAFENRATFTPDELAAIAKIRKQIDSERQNLFAIRSGLNQEIDHIKAQTRFWGIYAIPLLLLLGLAAASIRHYRPTSRPWHLGSRAIIVTGAVSLLILAAGLAAVIYQPGFAGADFEDKPLFPTLAQNINQADSLTLRTHRQSLTFRKDSSGLWQLESRPDFLVYQNRIRSFLSALLEAEYYEKKASGFENLASFGLLPTENPNSAATQVILSAKGKTLLNFDIGQYDLDLGRGSRGAYIRFDNSFQVWLASADLIDLSLDPGNWTYSTLWNLQFGRITAINGITDVDTLADLAKDLLNTRLEQAANLPADLGAPVYRLDISAENDVRIIINFYQKSDRCLAVYKFVNISSSPLLQNFATYAKAKAYEISAAAMENLIHAHPFDRGAD